MTRVHFLFVTGMLILLTTAQSNEQIRACDRSTMTACVGQNQVQECSTQQGNQLVADGQIFPCEFISNATNPVCYGAAKSTEDVCGEAPPICIIPGRFPVTGRCRNFYSCIQNGSLVFQVIEKCDEGLEFNTTLGRCVSVETAGCSIPLTTSHISAVTSASSIVSPTARASFISSMTTQTSLPTVSVINLVTSRLISILPTTSSGISVPNTPSTTLQTVNNSVTTPSTAAQTTTNSVTTPSTTMQITTNSATIPLTTAQITTNSVTTPSTNAQTTTHSVTIPSTITQTTTHSVTIPSTTAQTTTNSITTPSMISQTATNSVTTSSAAATTNSTPGSRVDATELSDATSITTILVSSTPVLSSTTAMDQMICVPLRRIADPDNCQFYVQCLFFGRRKRIKCLRNTYFDATTGFCRFNSKFCGTLPV